MHRVSEVGLKAKIDFTDSKIIVILPPTFDCTKNSALTEIAKVSILALNPIMLLTQGVCR